MADYYALLGLEKTASAEEVRAAYRRGAAKYHPDRNPGDEEAAKKFCELTQAYETLVNPEKRRMHDAALLGPQGSGVFGSTADSLLDALRRGDLFDTLAAEVTNAMDVFARATGMFDVKRPTSRDECESCDGSGEVKLEIGPIIIKSSCPYCAPDEKPSATPADRP